MSLEEDRELLCHSEHVLDLLFHLMQPPDFLVPVWDISLSIMLHALWKYVHLVLLDCLLELGFKFCIQERTLLSCEVVEVFCEEILSLLTHGKQLNFLALEVGRSDHITYHYVPLFFGWRLHLDQVVKVTNVEQLRIDEREVSRYDDNESVWMLLDLIQEPPCDALTFDYVKHLSWL